MQILIGPVYIAHPYSDDPERNVVLAAELSTAVNALGVATVSPLQESIGRESAIGEPGWRLNGIAQESVCKAVLMPDYWSKSSGCVDEHKLAILLRIPRFFACRIDDQWILPSGFLRWVEAQKNAQGVA